MIYLIVTEIREGVGNRRLSHMSIDNYDIIYIFIYYILLYINMIIKPILITFFKI